VPVDDAENLENDGDADPEEDDDDEVPVLPVKKTVSGTVPKEDDLEEVEDDEDDD
jgi:hypothetical protein